MKRLSILLAILLLLVAVSPADVLTIQFDNANQTGNPGNTISFLATLTNTGSDTIYLDTDSLTYASDGLIDNFSFPAFLNAGDSVSGIDLFDVVLADVPGTYDGSFVIHGTTGLDGADSVLGSANFSATINGATGVPEPSTVIPMLLGITAVLSLRRRIRPAYRCAL